MIYPVQARARTELREVATEDDAKDVIEIMKYRLLNLNMFNAAIYLDALILTPNSFCYTVIVTYEVDAFL